jgi:predicted dehydrogenase
MVDSQKKMRVFSIGIVGNNLYGQTFAHAAATIEGAKVIALCPELSESLEPFATLMDLHPYPDLATMLAVEKPDAVLLACVSANHERDAMLALEAGAHVLVDRPMAMTKIACDRMLATANGVHRVLMVAHVLQFWPEYVTIREMIKRGSIGEPRVVTASRVSGLLDPSWRARVLNPLYGLGVLEAHIHDIEYITGLFGQPIWISAEGSRMADGTWVQMYTLLRFNGGCHSAIEADYSVPCGYPLTMYLRVVGEKGSLLFNFSGALSARDKARRSLTLFTEDAPPRHVDVPMNDAYQGMIMHFINCAQQGRQPKWGSARKARASLGILSAITDDAVAHQTRRGSPI